MADVAIDLRSDLMTVPTDEMWEAMRAAELGWATYGEDDSVNRLEAAGAALLGHEAAVWVPTCGMANLAALSVHAEPGQGVVLEAAAHILTSEGMAISELAGLEPFAVWAADGRLDPARVEEELVQQRAAVLALENTHTRAGGTVLGVEETSALVAVARRHGARVHLDGARLANAAVALGVEPRALASEVDSVALSLNKGLSAPFGTILAGSQAFIDSARRRLLQLGGATMHRAGIAAAAGLVALETMWDRLAEDHRRARELGEGLSAIDGLRLDPERVETNIVLVDVTPSGWEPPGFVEALARHGVRALERDGSRIRLVTHRLIDDEAIERAIAAAAAVAQETTAAAG
ncbi:MAG: threonine aldolase [Gaiellaceae bacterium]|nr:MAG: threonine aldolase [Gaiellaceae bacterium]